MGWCWSSHTDHRSASSAGRWGSGSWNNKKIRERTTALLPLLGAPVVTKIAQWFPGSQIWPVRVGAALRGTPPPVLGLLTGLPAPLKHQYCPTLQRTWGKGSLSGRRLPTPRVSVIVVTVWQGKLQTWLKNFPSCCPGLASFNAPVTWFTSTQTECHHQKTPQIWQAGPWVRGSVRASVKALYWGWRSRAPGGGRHV